MACILGKKRKEKANARKLWKEPPKNKKLAGMYGDKNKVTRGDIIMAAKEGHEKRQSMINALLAWHPLASSFR